jgi:hypothetical protein
LDLLGDPIPEGMGKRGRPPHIVTLENRRKVMMLAAFDRNEMQIAAALSISVPTLKKHYFRELRDRLEARQRVEGKALMALVEQVEKGNAAAIALLFKRFDRHDLARGLVAPASPPAKKPKLGKKEQLVVDAREGAQSGEWGSLLKH